MHFLVSKVSLYCGPGGGAAPSEQGVPVLHVSSTTAKNAGTVTGVQCKLNTIPEEGETREAHKTDEGGRVLEFTRKVNIRLPGRGNSNSHGARSVY